MATYPLVLLSSLLLATACSADGSSAAPSKPATPVVSAAVTSDAAPAPKAAPADLCGEIRARFMATHATATGACTTDADCGCYNPVGGPELGCGGVADATTAAALATIETEFHAASCPWTHQCGPWACVPTCDAGRCRR